MSSLTKFAFPPLLLLAITLPFYDFYNPLVIDITDWKCADKCVVNYEIENLSTETQAIIYSIEGQSLRGDSQPNPYELETLFETTQDLDLEPGEKRQFEHEFENMGIPNVVSGRRIDQGGFKRWMRGLHAAFVKLMLGIE